MENGPFIMASALSVTDHYASFSETAASHLPGFLFSFNVADARRRNQHLGYHVVDLDIAEFDDLMKRFIAEDSFFKRVGGDKWLMISKRNRAKEVQFILDRYAKSKTVITGWISHAQKDGVTKRNQLKVSKEIRRAIRCLFTDINSQDEIAATLKQIQENDWGLPVSVPISLSDVMKMERISWQCIDEIRTPSDDPFICLFCKCGDLEWVDGDMSTYGGDGLCKQCGAEISIETV